METALPLSGRGEMWNCGTVEMGMRLGAREDTYADIYGNSTLTDIFHVVRRHSGFANKRADKLLSTQQHGGSFASLSQKLLD